MFNIKLEQKKSLLKKQINNILKIKSKNKIFKNITITYIKLTNNNNYALIYWTTYFNTWNIQIIDNELKKASFFFRIQLAKISNKYTVPQIYFKYDNTHIKIEKIEKILKNIKN